MQVEKCIIKSYESDRGFGFVYVGPSSKEVFFHKSAFPSNFYEHLKIGLELSGEIRVKDDGRPQVRACRYHLIRRYFNIMPLIVRGQYF